jgi:hypothetical protein
VTALLDQFRSSGGYVLLEETDFASDLRVALRVTLLTSFTLDSFGEDPSSFRQEIDMLRDDIQSAIESYTHVASTVGTLTGINTTKWIWQTSAWAELRASFSKDLGVMGAEDTSIAERYASLVRLCRYQLLIWSQTLGLTSKGYIA